MARTRTGLSTLSQRSRAVCSAADDHLRLKYNRRLVYTHTHTTLRLCAAVYIVPMRRSNSCAGASHLSLGYIRACILETKVRDIYDGAVHRTWLLQFKDRSLGHV